MGYPVAYRQGQRLGLRVGGPQSLPSVPRVPPEVRPYRPPLRPARVVPPAANDAVRIARDGLRRYGNPVGDVLLINDIVSGAFWPAPDPTKWGRADLTPRGWTRTVNCSGNGDLASSVSLFTYCSGLESVIQNTTGFTVSTNANTVSTWYYSRPYIGAFGRYWEGQTFTRPGGSTAPFSMPISWAPPVVPLASPSLNPMAIPIGQPMSVPEPVPFRMRPLRRPNPSLSPTEQSQRGYQIGVADLSAVQGQPNIEFSNAPEPSPSPRYEMKPPGKGEKERKFSILKGTLVGRVLQGAHHGLTEFQDAVDAIWKALPYDLRGPKDSLLQEKLWAIYTHFDDIDMQKAIVNLIRNQVVDYVIGSTQGRAASALNDLGILGGRTIFAPTNGGFQTWQGAFGKWFKQNVF